MGQEELGPSSPQSNLLPQEQRGLGLAPQPVSGAGAPGWARLPCARARGRRRGVFILVVRRHNPGEVLVPCDPQQSHTKVPGWGGRMSLSLPKSGGPFLPTPNPGC